MNVTGCCGEATVIFHAAGLYEFHPQFLCFIANGDIMIIALVLGYAVCTFRHFTYVNA